MVGAAFVSLIDNFPFIDNNSLEAIIVIIELVYDPRHIRDTDVSWVQIQDFE